MYSVMLTDTFQDGDNSIPIRYRFDGKLFNLRRLQAKSKLQTEVLDEFLFANDMAKGAPTEEKMQKSVDQVSDSCDSYDLTISIKKTEVVYISQHLESLTRSLSSQWKKIKVREKSTTITNRNPSQTPRGRGKVNDCKSWTSSPILEAYCLELCTLMMKSMPGLPKLVQHLADTWKYLGLKKNLYGMPVNGAWSFEQL